MNKLVQYWLILISIASLGSCADNSTESSESAVETSIIPPSVVINYSIVQSYPHDTSAFTQGLELFKGVLLESTGLLGKSSLRKVDLRTGKVLKKLDMDKAIFAEGLTSLHDTIYQLSWQNHLVFMYDANNLKPIGQLNWSGEGWGLTNDGNSLIISDGSDKLYFVEPGTLKLKNILSVVDQYGPLNNLNELEMVEGYIFANRWQYDYILKIDPANGHVVGTLNMKDFLQKNSRSDLGYLKQPGSTAVESGAVLNGIAYDKEKKSLYITGKLWPELFEVRLN